MDFRTGSRIHLLWLLISLTVVFAPGLDASEVGGSATAMQLTERIAPKILAPLSQEAVASDSRPKVIKLSTEEAVALPAAAGLVGAVLAAALARRSHSSFELQTAGRRSLSRGPPSTL
jgi:hypothetical protein